MKKWLKYPENKPEIGQWCYIISSWGVRNIARYKYGFMDQQSYAWPHKFETDEDKFKAHLFKGFGDHIFGVNGCDTCTQIGWDPKYWIPIDSLDYILPIPEIPEGPYKL